MALFLAMGGSGGGATVTLTFSSEFYGQTITATNGTKTVTKVAPSTGTMEITLPESGTWIISCTVSGSTYSTTVEVDLDYTATLEALPDGSTVLPTDDIQTWLKCAGIRDKTTYTTLADVLADTETFIALCADSNACDYMARSTTWALNSGEVPTLSSDTGSNGQCVKSTAQNNFPAYYAFDDNDSTKWRSSSGTNEYLGYHFDAPVVINKVTFKSEQDSFIRLKNYEIRGSNDNFATYETLALGTYANNVHVEEVDLNNTDAYSDYCLYCIDHYSTSAYGFSIVSLQFYQADITTNPTAMLIVGKYDYCANALLSDSTWASAICNSTYADSVIEELVPVMTSATTPSGVASASTEYDASYAAWKAFDGVAGDLNGHRWNSAADAGNGSWIKYDFGKSVKVVKARINPFYTSNTLLLKSYSIQTSNDDVWTDPNTVFSETLSNEVTDKTVIFSNENGDRYIRVLATSDSYFTTGAISISNLQFYGRVDHGYTGTVIHSAVEDTTYYMEGGQSVPFCTIASGDTETVLASTIESLKNQTITLYSSVAKDPTNLSNDYSKQIRITPNVTEIYLMPLGAVYWYGSNNGVEAGTSANGWTGSHMGGSVTFNKDSASIIAGSGQETGLTTHDAITAFDKLHCIVNTSYNSTVFLMYGSKNYAGSALVQKTLSTGLTHDELTITSKTGYPMIYEYNNKTITGYAMWIE